MHKFYLQFGDLREVIFYYVEIIKSVSLKWSGSRVRFIFEADSFL